MTETESAILAHARRCAPAESCGFVVRTPEGERYLPCVNMAYSRVSTFSGDYIRVTDNKGKTHDVLTGSDDGRHSNTSLAWGAGVQFNPTESVAIDIAYEGSGSGDWRTDGFIVGVGYKF